MNYSFKNTISVDKEKNKLHPEEFFPFKQNTVSRTKHTQGCIKVSQQLPIKIIETVLALIWLYNVQLYEDNEEDLSEFMGEGG